MSNRPSYYRSEVPLPQILLSAQNLEKEGSRLFLKYFNETLIRAAICNIVSYLYTAPGDGPISFRPTLPNVKSITFYLDEMDGCAYTTSKSDDSEAKEIHCSLSYFIQAADPAREINGVLTHELVHCFQYDWNAPSGLTEGVADFVRLKSGLAPPHWPLPQDDRGESWDAGYQWTAYFLQWLEDIKIGWGAVGFLNNRLLTDGYDDNFFNALYDCSLDQLWAEYNQYLDS